MLFFHSLNNNYKYVDLTAQTGCCVVGELQQEWTESTVKTKVHNLKELQTNIKKCVI